MMLFYVIILNFICGVNEALGIYVARLQLYSSVIRLSLS